MASGFVPPSYMNDDQMREAVQPSWGTVLGKSIGKGFESMLGGWEKRMERSRADAAALRLRRQKLADQFSLVDHKEVLLRNRPMSKKDVRSGNLADKKFALEGEKAAAAAKQGAMKAFTKKAEQIIDEITQTYQPSGPEGNPEFYRARAGDRKATVISELINIDKYKKDLVRRGLSAKEVKKLTASMMNKLKADEIAVAKASRDDAIKGYAKYQRDELKRYIAKAKANESVKSDVDMVKAWATKNMDMWRSFRSMGVTEIATAYGSFFGSGGRKISGPQMKLIYGSSEGHSLLNEITTFAARYGGMDMGKAHAANPRDANALVKKWAVFLAGTPGEFEAKGKKLHEIFALAGVAFSGGLRNRVLSKIAKKE